MGVHKTHGQENTTHKKAKSSAHFKQVITKHIVKKTQHTKEPRGQLFPAGYQKTHSQENTTHKRAKRLAHFQNIVKKTQHNRAKRSAHFQ